MGFLISLFFFLLIIAFVVLFFIMGFLRSIFGFGRRRNPFRDAQEFSEKQKKQHNPFKSTKKQKKIIGKNEGEYVDYEEMK